MYLKSLTLRGFKSFAQATTFAFEPGVTAIVGPNGSGKSNVVDALAWVMGEQGAKTLRGGKMEDVIFAGTSTRGPLGRAEVRLTIDNSDGALPIDYSEVTISRILFRNGSSEYAINGETCRLLDVQELLSDSGLGREMHVIVGQGQLDAVLRATPEDRRGFIEEAAGILKHRRRKEKTLRKLEAMQANLTRLNDLAGEIRRQLKPLGRQAEVARRAQGIAATARDARARLLADDVHRLRAELRVLGAGDDERQSEQAVLEEQLAQKHQRIERIEQEHLSDAVNEARGVTLGLESLEARLRGLNAQVNQRLTFLATQGEANAVPVGVTEAAVAEARNEAAALLTHIPEAEAALAEHGRTVGVARASLDALDEHLAAQSALVSSHDLEVSAHRGAVDAAAQRLAAVRGERLRRENALEQAREREATAGAELDAAPEPDHAPGADSDLADQLREETERAESAETVLDTLRAAVSDAERQLAGLEARQDALALALERQETASAAALGGVDTGIIGAVADQMTVDAGWESAVGVALGSLAEALLATDREAAYAAITRADRDRLGRVGLVIAETSAATQPVARVSPEGAVWAPSVVTAAPGILGLLGEVYLTEDLAAARRAWPTLSAAGGPATSLITRDGIIITEHTALGGSGEAPSRIELAADRDRAESRAAEVRERLDAAQDELAAGRERLRDAKARAVELQQRVREIESARARETETRNRLLVRAESARAEAERLAEGLSATEGDESKATAALDGAQSLLAQTLGKPRPILDAGERDSVRADLDRARAGELEARLALETLRERVRAADERATRVEEQLLAERRAAEEAARRQVLRARQVARATRVADALPGLRAALDRSLAEARHRQLIAEQERARNSEELTRVRREEGELRDRLRVLTEQSHRAELTSYERTLQLTSFLERAASELGLVEDVLVSEYGPDQPIPTETAAEDPSAAEPSIGEMVPETETPKLVGAPYVRAEQEARLARAERELTQLGRINPLALEEYSALEQRHRFLTEQLTDLTNTRKDLLAIIADLDEQMEGIFASAFVDTQAAFARVFPVLFPGGSGEVSLTNPADLLGTGIEMTVRPAGKKVERLSLLSGGERSLAAVAWLIAIFTARPSPFYIMDEVEAALDDANLGRLLQVFEGLRESSQLIVITHQKRTMEIADALYGVSMRQDGISAVVGQRLAPRESGLETE